MFNISCHFLHICQNCPPPRPPYGCMTQGSSYLMAKIKNTALKPMTESESMASSQHHLKFEIGRLFAVHSVSTTRLVQPNFTQKSGVVFPTFDTAMFEMKTRKSAHLFHEPRVKQEEPLLKTDVADRFHQFQKLLRHCTIQKNRGMFWWDQSRTK